MIEYEDIQITGTDLWYFMICKRELWLMKHHITPDQEDENIEIGRFLHEYYNKRGKHEVDIGSGKIDRLKKIGGEFYVQEIKKSGKYRKSSRYQLLFYLYELRKMGIDAKGELIFTEERRREKVILTQERKKELEDIIQEIKEITKREKPPKPEKISFCRQCAYREFCWAGE